MCNVGGTELDQLISRFSLPEMDQTWSRKGFRKRLPTLVDRQRPTFCWTISSNLGIPDPTNPPSAVGLELAAFFLFDWNPSVTDIREQYPLRLEDTSELAAQAHIRYRPDTASVALNDYLREFRTKLTSHKNHLETVSISARSSQGEKTKALKEIEKITKMIAEMEEYEREVLYPLATEQVEIDLDDGVKANYPRLGAALKKIPGLEAQED